MGEFIGYGVSVLKDEKSPGTRWWWWYNHVNVLNVHLKTIKMVNFMPGLEFPYEEMQLLHSPLTKLPVPLTPFRNELPL